METLPTIIITAFVSAFTAFLFSEFISWKTNARRERIEDRRRILEELYSPLSTIINWMSIRTRYELEKQNIGMSSSGKEEDIVLFVLHPHQYEKLWTIRSKYLYLFQEKQNEALFEIDQIFLSLKLKISKVDKQERWIISPGSRKEANEKKERMLSEINNEIQEISTEINKLNKVTKNLGNRIWFLLRFWKL